MDDLIAFLRARLDEDELGANSCAEPHWRPDGANSCAVWVLREDDSKRTIARCANGYDDDFANSLHIARHDPARVLADVAAKRAIIELHSRTRRGACPVCWRVTHFSSIREDFPCPTLRILALPYADHPDYREEWKP